MARRFANLIDLGRLVTDIVNGGQAVSQDSIPAISSLQSNVLSSYSVASAPPVATAGIGRIAYFTNGASGSACVAFCNSVAWLRTDNGEAISAGA